MHVAIIHHETTADVLNPLEAMAKAVLSEFPEKCFIGFAAYNLQMEWGMDFVVCAANKRIEGAPHPNSRCFDIAAVARPPPGSSPRWRLPLDA